MPPPALFAVAHPDDETLGFGVAIAEHVAAGQDVHLLWLTRGTASGARSHLNGTTTSTWWGVRHVPAAEGYPPLSPEDLGRARIAEGNAAVRCLAAGLPGMLTVHEAGLPDGQVGQAAAQAAMLAVADDIAPGQPVRIKTHSPVVDNHPDHLAAGRAGRALAAADPNRFSDLRHYVLPSYWSDPRLGQVTEAWDNPTNADIRLRARNAGRAYAAWQPRSGAYAVGWHSVSQMFMQLETNPRCLFHT